MTEKKATKSTGNPARELSPKERRAVAGGAEDDVLVGTGNNQA